MTQTNFLIGRGEKLTFKVAGPPRNPTEVPVYSFEEAKKKHILLSEYEVREILASMEQQGWVKIRRGRGGTRITQKGEDILQKENG